MNTVTFEMIKEAAQNLKGVIKETDFCFAESLSERSGAEVYLKLENLQQSGSFKIRGAYNKMLHLSDEENNVVLLHQVLGITHKVLQLVQRNLASNRPLSCQGVHRLLKSLLLAIMVVKWF